MKRTFYYQNDRSNKFWTIEVSGCAYITTNGRIGATPRETRKAFADAVTLQKEYEKQIAAKLHSGYTEGIAPAYKKPDWASMSMTDEVFWRLIALFNWKQAGDDEAVVEPAVAALAQMAENDIEKFEDILSEKLYAIDTMAYAKECGDDAYEPGKYFSGDCFLYQRCCVVANGCDFYKSVLSLPANMPKDLEFEALLSVARNAFERKTGKEFEHHSKVSYESFSNDAGWPDGDAA